MLTQYSLKMPHAVYGGENAMENIAAIIKAENLDVTDEEIEEKYKSMAEQYGMELDMLKKYLDAPTVRNQLLNEKAIAVVVDSAKAEKPAKAEKTEGEEEKKPAKKTAKKAAEGEEEKKPAAKKAPAKKAPAKKAAAKKAEVELVKIELIHSLNGKVVAQKATAESLGLKRIGDTTVQPNNAATQGKINKIMHLIAVSKA